MQAPTSCPICLNIDQNKNDFITCNTCKNSFCKQCALLWKIDRNECPFKCSSPWDLDLSFLSNDNTDGFIICPLCSRLGSLLCPKASCRTKIIYEEDKNCDSILCAFCRDEVKLYCATKHGDCSTWNDSFYFYCEKCDKKFCNCIIKNQKKL